MAKIESFITISGIILDKNSEIALYKQLYNYLKEGILCGRFSTGARLPSTRAFARELNLSRSTVLLSIDQLIAEGYLESHVGRGTFVSQDLPDMQVKTYQHNKIDLNTAIKLSNRADAFIASRVYDDSSNPAFRPGIPETSEFPFKIWRKILNKHWRQPKPQDLFYGSGAGYLPLRQEIANYLKIARGVNCAAEQLIIVNGSQQALQIASYLLADANDEVWIENPGYTGAQAAFKSAMLKMVAVPVDDEGLSVKTGIKKAPKAKFAYVSPSHQYPLGVTMSLARRLELLDWAKDNNAWILEDDYDSEFRFKGQPLSALQGLDRANRVVYIGSFSKVLFPALRLGYVLVPKALAEAFIKARLHFDRGSPWINQMVLADFIAEGHFARHIRKMRVIYGKRRELLISQLAKYLPEFGLGSSPAGMHLILYLPANYSDIEVAKKLKENQIETFPLSNYSLDNSHKMGLVLGYGAVSETQMKTKIPKLAELINLYSPS